MGFEEQMNDVLMKSLEEMEVIKSGEIVTGTVEAVDETEVYVNVGGKSEGRISLSEFGNEVPKVNDKVEVLVERTESQGGLKLSKIGADSLKYKSVLKNAFKNKEAVYGKFVKAVSNGLEVELANGAGKGFCPISKADIEKTETGDKLVGVESGFKILKLERNSPILSRKDFLREQIEERRDAFFANTKQGDVVTGTVKSFTSFGAFVDLGGFDGLLHINDMSWGHVSKPKEYVKKGQVMEFIVLAMDQEEKKINLSLKHFTKNPWMDFSEKYHVDDIVKGKVTKMIEFGAFVEIEEGIEGFVHVSELSWVKRIKHPKEVLTEGQEIEAKILECDVANQRISLGVKQVMPNPWETINERFKEGQVITGPVVKLTNAGAFVKLEEGIDGFVHVDDLSWTKKVKTPGAILTVGEEYQFVVLSVNTEERRIRLGMKQLTSDPWQAFADKYKKFSEVEGEISAKTEFGLFVKVDGDIEGLINVHQLPEDEEGADPAEVLAKYNVGDKIKCAVFEINPAKKRLSLSVKALIISQQQQEISKYMQDDNEEEPTASFADFLK